MIWSTLVESHVNTLLSCESLSSVIEDAGNLLRKVLDQGGKIFTCGNGRSTAQAYSLASALVGRFREHRLALPAIVLGSNSAISTGLTNDFGSPSMYSRELQALHNDKDALVCFCTSGKSVNVLEALDYARRVEMSTVVITGIHGVPSYLKATKEIRVPSDDTPRIHDIHHLIVHALCEYLDT